MSSVESAIARTPTHLPRPVTRSGRCRGAECPRFRLRKGSSGPPIRLTSLTCGLIRPDRPEQGTNDAGNRLTYLCFEHRGLPSLRGRASHRNSSARRMTAAGRTRARGRVDTSRAPAPGFKCREGHTIIYDGHASTPIRSIHIAGTLRFDPQIDTRLDVGLIKIQAGDDASESGFDCESHAATPAPERRRATLEVGGPGRPIARGRTALIRLLPFPGLDPDECPAIICCGGRMDFHGAGMSRTWVKLAETAAKGSATVTLDEPVTGWRAGDRVIITATSRQRVADEGDVPSVRVHPQTEERTIRSLDGLRLTLDTPLAFAHAVKGPRRGEVANLSRNVIVESAAPAENRGHTMYHRHSTGSISYAEFRHLGKPGKLGKYSLHFHKVGDTMRGASVVGASIWDSGNRWITIHGTNFLAVRDCVGYGSVGHGFFLEDGTEVDNILDGNLAVQACQGSPLPGQALAFDRNEGAGFWWANSRNAFMRTSRSSAISMASDTRRQRSRASTACSTFAVRTTSGALWISAPSRSFVSRITKPIRSAVMD